MSSTPLVKKPGRGTVPENDICSGTPEEVGLAIAQCLRCKGYCAITEGINEDTLEQARNDIVALDTAGKLQQPPLLIQEGLLGVEGSTRIAALSPVDFNDNAKASEGNGLRDVDLVMWMLAKAIEPFQDTIGLRCTSRSAACVHQAGTLDEEVPLSDQEASLWLSVFVRQKMLILVFLGLEKGMLELRPYDDDANPVQITTEPGLIMLIRTDQLAYRLTTQGSAPTDIVSCFCLQDDILRLHKNVRDQHMVPSAVELENWVNTRLKELKDGEEKDTIWDESIPRPFILAMNHHFYKRQQVVVRGVSGRFPACWDAETFFLTQTFGPDLVTEVPLTRWDHSTIYDESPDCWQQDPPKTSCRHAAFMDGVDLFDNKMFGLSVSEVRGMDPSQRQVLEVAYDALYRSGMKKSTLMNSTCGMYVGTSMSEWNYAERSADVGIFGATGGAPSITAGRISFCLGLKGSCLAIDSEAASSLTAVYWAAESVQKKGRAPIQELACAIGVHLVLAKTWWPAHTAAGFLCPAGRCFTFDDTGRGYVRGEGCSAAVVRLLKESTDGEPVVDDGQPFCGLISGGAQNNNGRNASLLAPHGPAEQQVLSEACRQAGITPLDVDCVECHGSGSVLADAVEATSCAKALRSGEQIETLMLTSVKTLCGNSIENAGTTSFLKVLHSIKWGFQPGNIHLRQINQHLESEDSPLLLSTECLEYRMRSTFCGVSARGFGGTNCHVICYGNMDEEMRPPPQAAPEDRQPRLSYWPAGGGSLEGSARPKKGYSIVGSWNDWGASQAMEDEGDGCYGCDVVLGENRWEQFRILLDGDERKVLHPQRYAAPKGTMVFGPSSASESQGSTWLIDARSELMDATEDGSTPQAITDGTGEGQPRQQLVMYGEDLGSPGDTYRVRIHVVGKFRTVTWSKVEGCSTREVVRGRYYVAASWNNWQFDEMQESSSSTSTFELQVKLPRGDNEFQIVRNRDWHQAIFPAEARGSAEAKINGPVDRVRGLNWAVVGKVGQSYRITFRRAFESGRDLRSISWAPLA